VSTGLPDLAPFARTRLVDEVTDRLRNLIVDGTLAPGQRLLQTSLSEQLGVSRTPLREALRVLQNEGFVEFVDGNKTLAVVDLSAEELVAAYQLREVVDGLAARLAATRGISSAMAKRLHDVIAQMRAAPGPRKLNRRAPAHSDFHASIALASENRHVIGQIPMIRFTAEMGTRFVQSLDEDARAQTHNWIETGDGNHFAILQAIERGDAREAERAARVHIRNTVAAILRLQA
jgi:DNA-binding GntR family transcriptional regulator